MFDRSNAQALTGLELIFDKVTLLVKLHLRHGSLFHYIMSCSSGGKALIAFDAIIPNNSPF